MFNFDNEIETSGANTRENFDPQKTQYNTRNHNSPPSIHTLEKVSLVVVIRRLRMMQIF